MYAVQCEAQAERRMPRSILVRASASSPAELDTLELYLGRGKNPVRYSLCVLSLDSRTLAVRACADVASIFFFFFFFYEGG